MAIYHLSFQIIKRSAGRSSVAAAAYRAGQTLLDERTGLVHDYRAKTGCDHQLILAPEHAPEWVFDRAKLWNLVEQKETRKDAQLCREIDIALPIELNQDQMIALVHAYVQAEFVPIGMVADVAFHHLHSHNPHCHIMLTMRDLVGGDFGAKNRAWNDKALLQKWRENWSIHTNKMLTRIGSTERIDHRTLKAQQIHRSPTEHLGVAVNQMLSKASSVDELPDRAVPTLILRVQQHLKRIAAELKRITAYILELKKDEQVQHQQLQQRAALQKRSRMGMG